MKYLELTIGAVLVNNFVLTRFLGICPFLGVSKRLDTALGMGGAVTVVMALASCITSVISNYLLSFTVNGKVVDLSFWPDHPQVQQNESGVQMELPGMFQILYYDPEGQLQGQTVRWQGTWGMSMGEAARAEAVIHLSGKPQASLSELRADILLDTQISARQGMEMVSGLVLGEMQQADEERPSLFLRRVGGDSLWELAKRTGSTVEAICEANRLTDDPGPERLLLIPVS